VPKFACCLLCNVHVVRLVVSPSAKIYWWAKTPQPRGRGATGSRWSVDPHFFEYAVHMRRLTPTFCQLFRLRPPHFSLPSAASTPTAVSRFWTNVHQILRACGGVPVNRQMFSDCWYHVPFQRYVRSNFKVGPKSVFAPSPEEFGPNFSNNSHKWTFVQVWLRSVQWPQRLDIEKKKKERPPWCRARKCNYVTTAGLMYFNYILAMLSLQLSASVCVLLFFAF